jgi:sugar (pentulose or hexulose) kinase
MQVIAVIDVGKTNKKLFLFDQQYRIVCEKSARFIETVDEDGDPCENLKVCGSRFTIPCRWFSAKSNLN